MQVSHGTSLELQKNDFPTQVILVTEVAEITPVTALALLTEALEIL